MAVKIRLTRKGDKRNPFYRIVVADSKTSRDAEYIDLLGTFNPLLKDEKEQIKLNVELTQKWLNNGAKPTETARELLDRSGIDIKKVVPKNEKITKKASKKKDAKK